METTSFADIIPLADLKRDPASVVAKATKHHRPVLLTTAGRAVAVMQAISDYEAAECERAFLRAVVIGLADLAAGRELSLAQVKARLRVG